MKVGFLVASLLVVSAYDCLGQEDSLLPRPKEEYVVRFASLRTISDDGRTSFEGFESSPSEVLKLPSVDTTGARYLSVFYTRAIPDYDGDPSISILALPKEEGWLLYADLNNDEDLTNDGKPRLLTQSNSVVLAISAPHDSFQVTHRSLQFVPTAVRVGLLPESWLDGMTDDEGNLKPHVAELSRVSAEKGTFLFGDRPIIARGHFIVDDDSVEIGIYDENVNGLYNETGTDRLLVDLDGDDKLMIGSPQPDMLNLDDVFSVAGRQFKLTHVDKYGRGVRVVEVLDEPTSTYLAEKKLAYKTRQFEPIESHQLDSTFWNIELPTIDGDSLQLSDFQGKALLLNFWGEWCGPCLVEMPELVRADSAFSGSGFQMLGVVASNDYDATRAFLKRMDADWPQVVLTDEIRDRFRIRLFPTNLFISSEGEQALEARTINYLFVEQMLEREK